MKIQGTTMATLGQDNSQATPQACTCSNCDSHCSTCGKDYSPACDHNQGRCEHPLAKPVINAPTPELHRNISFAKSLLRVVAGAMLMNNQLTATGIFLILAELLGVVEEIV